MSSGGTQSKAAGSARQNSSRSLLLQEQQYKYCFSNKYIHTYFIFPINALLLTVFVVDQRMCENIFSVAVCCSSFASSVYHCIELRCVT